MVELLKTLLANQFFTGAAAAGLIASIVMFFKARGSLIATKISHQLFTSVQFEQPDELFVMFGHWWDKQKFSRRTRTMIVKTKWAERTVTDRRMFIISGDEGGAWSEEKPKLEFLFLTAPGIYWFRFNKKLFYLHVERRELQNASEMSFGYRDTIRITYMGRSRKHIEKLLESVKAEYETEKEEKAIKVYISTGSSWNLVSRRPPIPQSSLIYSTDLLTDITTDIEKFLNERNFYDSNGIPYKRGFLLHGPPGNGKTSLVRYLGGYFNRGIYVVDVKNLTMSSLRTLSTNMDPHGFLLFEDIDAVTTATKKVHDDEEKEFSLGLTYYDLIEFFDGVSARDGQIVFATTNYKDKIKPALLRPGRFDRHIFVDNANKEQIRKMFQKFFSINDEFVLNVYCDNFIKGIDGNQVSMAQLQEHLMRFRGDPQKAANTHEWRSIES